MSVRGSEQDDPDGRYGLHDAITPPASHAIPYITVPPSGSRPGSATRWRAASRWIARYTVERVTPNRSPSSATLCSPARCSATMTLVRIVFDCPSPRALAGFYEKVLGMHRVLDTPERVELSDQGPDTVHLAFQYSAALDGPRPEPRGR